MSLFTVDKNKCLKCGACADVCPSRLIALDPWPVKAAPHTCIACGHCVAVCPAAALDNRKAPLAGQTDLEGFMPPAPAEMVKILRSRRSVRSYSDRPVETEQLRALLDAARYAPTGRNSQGLSFLILSGKNTLSGIGGAVADWMAEAEKTGAVEPDTFTGVLKNYRAGQDTILRGASCLIVAYAPKEHAYAQNNCAFVWAYAELFAPSLGLGTCIAGYVQWCAFAGYKPLLDALLLPDDFSVAGILLAGYPRYRYKRLPDRQALRIAERGDNV